MSDSQSMFRSLASLLLVLVIGGGLISMCSNARMEYLRTKQAEKIKCLRSEDNTWGEAGCITSDDLADQRLKKAEFDWCTSNPDHINHERCVQFAVESDDLSGGITLMLVPGIGIDGSPAIGIGGGLGIGL